MKNPPAAPQIPSQLTGITNFARAAVNDASITGSKASNQEVQVRAKSLSLSEVKLGHMNLSDARFERTDFIDCAFEKCEFTATHFTDGSWRRISIIGGRASGVQMQDSTLRDVVFDDCKINLANFRLVKFRSVRFVHCDLSEADFYGAELAGVSFENCDLAKAEFSQAKLKDVDFRTSDITNLRGIESMAGAIIDSTQLFALAPMLAANYKIIIKDD